MSHPLLSRTPGALAVFPQLSALPSVALLLVSTALPAADCNRNGVDDTIDLVPGTMAIVDSVHASVPDALGGFLADVDGDSDTDALFVSSFPGELRVLLNDGAGRLGEPAVSSIASELRFGAAGDIDGDLDLDLALLAESSVVVLKNLGLGKFEEADRVAIGSGPGIIAAGDFNGDRRADFVTGNLVQLEGETNVSVLLNDGSGNFNGATHFAAGQGSWDIAVADFDNDEDLDLAVLNGESGKVSVLENGSKGGFVSRGEISTGSTAFPLDLGTADLDGDLRADLIVFYSGAESKVLFGTGDRQFGAPFTLFWGSSTQQSALVDLDLDGDIDLVAGADGDCGSSTDLLVRRNLGEGAWEPEKRFGFDTGLFSLQAGQWIGGGVPETIAFGRLPESPPLIGDRVIAFSWKEVGNSRDCDQNGIPDECQPDCNANGYPDSCDVVSGRARDCNSSGVPDSCEADCNGNETPDDCDIALGASTDCDEDGAPDECETADANKNGVPDSCDITRGVIADCNANGIADDLDLKATITWLPSEYGGQKPLRAIIPGDWDGDGDIDLAGAEEFNALLLLLNQGAGTFDERRQSLGAILISDLISGDLDGDGDLDLIAAGTSFVCGGEHRGRVTMLLNDGRAHFTAFDAAELPGEAPEIVSGHLDGDSRLDIFALARGRNSFWLLRGTGDGALEPSARLVMALGEFPGERLAAADLDGDSRTDIATDAGILLWNEGNAQFSRGAGFPITDPNPDFDTRGIAAVYMDMDMDMDTDLDLVTGVVALNEGGRRFARGAAVSAAPADVAAGDWDADGDLDLAHVELCAYLAISRNRGNGTFEPILRLPSVAHPDLLTAGDFDGDGDPDLAVANGREDGISARSVSIHWNRAGAFTARKVYLMDEFLQELTAADIEGDGDRDFLAPGNDFLHVLRNDGSAGFVVESTSISPERHTGFVAANLDANPTADAVIGLEDSILILWNNGQGAFPESTTIPSLEDPSDLKAIDVDGDRDNDLCFLNGFNEVSLVVLRNDGARKFQRVQDLAFGSFFGRLLSRSDLDDDGDLDILFTRGQETGALVNDGAGKLSFGPDIPAGITAVEAAIIDLNDDGKLDLALVGSDRSHCENDPEDCSSRPALVVLLAKGGLEYEEPRKMRLSESSRGIAAADMDSDGSADLVLSLLGFDGDEETRTGHEVLVLLGDGAGAFPRRHILTVGPEPREVRALDLSGDQVPDIAVLNFTGITVQVTAARAPVSSDSNQDGRPDECDAARFSRGDWNQDGKLNLTDALALLDYLFRGGAEFQCKKAADSDDSGSVEITDAVRVLSFLFLGGTAPREPFPGCGVDPTGDALACAEFATCL